MSETVFYFLLDPIPCILVQFLKAYHVSSAHEHIGLSLVVSSISVCIATDRAPS